MGSELDAFLGRSDGLCHVDFWRALADLWRGADRDARRDERWEALWQRAGLAPGSENGLMTDAERGALAALPAEVRLSRAADDAPFAWRVDREGERGGTRVAATAARERVVALFEASGGRELIVLPRDVRSR